ncbi:MAG TPA: hypothetical protein VEA61_13470 [Allosphingosinicella sp.]|nr:hypothetical protein [Allosphingosinicella sp.]
MQRLADDGQAIVARQARLAAPLLGISRPIVEDSYGGIYGSAVTNGAGAFGRLTLGSVSLLGGVGWNEDRQGRAELRDAVTFAGALRYVHGAGPIRPFAEAGGWTTQGADLRLSRTYLNGAGTATGIADTEGDISYIYLRLGAALMTGGDNELAFSGEIGKARLDIDAYLEPLGATNPFEADVDERRERMRIVRLRGQYAHRIMGSLQATLYAARVWSREDGGRIVAVVPGIGTLGASPDNARWFEFGGRLTHDLGGALTIEIFGDGGTGEDRVGHGAQAGIALRTRF